MPSKGVVDFLRTTLSREYRANAFMTSGSGIWFVRTLCARARVRIYEREVQHAPPLLDSQSVLRVEARVEWHAVCALAQRDADGELLALAGSSLIDLEAVCSVSATSQSAVRERTSCRPVRLGHLEINEVGGRTHHVVQLGYPRHNDTEIGEQDQVDQRLTVRTLASIARECSRS
jgi:hypothetical protein